MEQNRTTQVEQPRQYLISSMSQYKSLTDKDYLNIHSEMLAACKDRDDCWFGNHPTLREMNETRSVKVGQGTVAKFLVILNIASNCKLKLSYMQIRMLSEEIYSKYCYLKDTEIMLFFHDFLVDHKKENTFFGAIDPNIIKDALHTFVREKRGNAIWEHDKKLHSERLEKEKSKSVDWQQYCEQKGIDSSDDPIKRIISNFGHKEPKDTPESIKKSAEELVYNRWGLDEKGIENARKSFMARHKCTSEYVIEKGKE